MPQRAVLISGGLDSAILLARALSSAQTVHPLYIRCGLAWEETELVYLHRFLEAIEQPALGSLTILEQPIGDIYGPHWSITGTQVPNEKTPDDAVYLPGRNVLLLGKALLWCHLHHVPTLALGTLSSNPFPDATPAFFDTFARVVSGAVAGNVHVERPFANLHKSEVMRLGNSLPLEHTFSCINPISHLHCGKCNKCAERIAAFHDASMTDPTMYAKQIGMP